MNKIDWKDVLIRGAKTGGQVFVGLVLVQGVQNVSLIWVQNAIASAVTAAISVAHNAMLQAWGAPELGPPTAL